LTIKLPEARHDDAGDPDDEEPQHALDANAMAIPREPARFNMARDPPASLGQKRDIEPVGERPDRCHPMSTVTSRGGVRQSSFLPAR
jgi:hypothetical protein